MRRPYSLVAGCVLLAAGFGPAQSGGSGANDPNKLRLIVGCGQVHKWWEKAGGGQPFSETFRHYIDQAGAPMSRRVDHDPHGNQTFDDRDSNSWSGIDPSANVLPRAVMGVLA